MSTPPTKLIYMANQIGKYFASQRRGDAVAGIAEHLTLYWEPRMRRQICAYLAEDGSALDPPVREAVERIAAAMPAAGTEAR